MLKIDRRWIYLSLALSVILPILFPFGLPVRPTQSVRSAYEALQKLPNGSRVLFSFDYGPATKVELHPMVIVALHECFKRDIQVAAMALDPAGQANASDAFRQVAPKYNKVEGTDYVNLGYKAGNEGVVISLGLDFRGTFPVDARGTLMNDIPMMRSVLKLSDFALVGSFAAGRPGALEHIRLTHQAYGRPLIVGVTAVMAPEYYTYYKSGQVLGLMGGLRAAAELEVLSGLRGTATPGLDAQSGAHFTIVFFILLSNVMYFSQRRKR